MRFAPKCWYILKLANRNPAAVIRVERSVDIFIHSWKQEVKGGYRTKAAHKRGTQKLKVLINNPVINLIDKKAAVL